jgi:ketosteroid isomerase-like protein
MTEKRMTAAATDDLRYHAPTPAQLAQAEDWVARFAAKWAKPGPDDLRDLMHADTRNLIPPMAEPGDREGVVAHFKGVLQMVPDLSLKVIRWAAAADTVMVEWQSSATVAGKALGWRGVDRVSLRDGKTYEGQVYWDTRGVAEMIAQAVSEAQAKAAQTKAAQTTTASA